MADYTELNPGTGGDLIVDDELADGTKLPVSKLVVGLPGNIGQQVTRAFPLPTSDEGALAELIRLREFVEACTQPRKITAEAVEGDRSPQLDSSREPARLNKEGCKVVSKGHARWYELASRRKIFTAGNAVAGVAPGTALSATPPIAVLNPAASGVAAVILRMQASYVSGTLGAGRVMIAQGVAPAVTPTANLSTTQVGMIGGRQLLGSSACRAYSGTNLTNAPIAISPFFTVGPALATTPAFPQAVLTETDYIVLPGAYICLSGIAGAGTTPLLRYSITWAELPLETLER